MSIWVRSFYLDFKKLRLHSATPFSLAQRSCTCFHCFCFFLCKKFSLFHISRLDMFLQTQNTTMTTKSKNKVTMSFYTAKFLKSNRKKMGKKKKICETLAHSKVFKSHSLENFWVHKPYFGLSFGPSKCLHVFNFRAISFFVWMRLLWTPYPNLMNV